MSAATETINVEEKFSGSSLNGRQDHDGSPEGADNLFAPDSDGDFYFEESGALNGSHQGVDPRVWACSLACHSY